jgi:hypothetical protein
MSASGDLPGIGALTVGGKCPDRSGEKLVKRLHWARASSRGQVVSRPLAAPTQQLHALFRRHAVTRAEFGIVGVVGGA